MTDSEQSSRNRWAIVTGANGGIGRYITLGLAEHGFKVVLATRNVKSGQETAEFVRSSVPTSTLKVMKLDLTSLESVSDFAFLFRELSDSVDLLVNNAGIMGGPYFTTEEGFEGQIGVNHLAHFALTAQLLPALMRSGEARVVSVSSILAKRGAIDIKSFDNDRSYRPYKAYAQSKLANQLFITELSRRCRLAGLPVSAVAAHPGYSATNLAYGPDAAAVSKITKSMMDLSARLFAQPPMMGARPILEACVAEDAHSGDYYGPTGSMELKGEVGKVAFVKAAMDQSVARELWRLSSELTKVEFDV